VSRRAHQRQAARPCRTGRGRARNSGHGPCSHRWTFQHRSGLRLPAQRTVVDEPDPETNTDRPPKPSAPSTTAPSSTTAASTPAKPSAPRPSAEETSTHALRINVVKSLYGGALLIRAGYTDDGEAQLTYTTAGANCNPVQRLAGSELVLDPRTGSWYDVTLLAVDKGQSVTIRVVRGHENPPKRSSVCGD
jgi:hypothetical protein